MKCFKILWIPTFVLAASTSFGQTQFRFGLTANPLVSWMKAESSQIDKGKVRAGVEYGFLTDIEFTDNYILATGITITVAGANLIYTDSLLPYNGDVHTKFKLQYLNLPVVFKMRSNEIGRFKYYGGLGLVPAFRIKARLDAEANDTQIFENKNIVKKKDQTGGVVQSVIFDLSLHVEAGMEYSFNGKTSLVAGLFYRNGFVNVIKDHNEDKISLNNLGLRVGFIF